jgi:5-methylcytosine-specific restriction endonuclease McrA
MEALRPLAIVGEPCWREAFRGNGEAALSLWAGLVRSGRGGPDAVDIAMSAVALAAARGCRACEVVLVGETARRRHRQECTQPPAGPNDPAGGDAARSSRCGMTGDRTAYRRYMRSRAWRSSPARLGEIEAARGACRLCGSAGPSAHLEAHHRTYARLGRERLDDLTLLCSACHVEVTAFLRARLGPPRIPPPPDLPPVERQALFDPLAPPEPKKD